MSDSCASASLPKVNEAYMRCKYDSKGDSYKCAQLGAQVTACSAELYVLMLYYISA